MKMNDLIRVITRTRTSSLSRAFCSSFTRPSGADVALKNVTRSNFEPALAELRQHVREADFVSIDLEMTGVTSAPWREAFEFDRPDIQYLKIKDSAEKFAVVQFGVCPFHWDPHSHCFVAQPHNFYIFPRQEIPGGGDGLSYEFLCQTSSLEFLAKYQFDFNACIYEGISYLSRRQEEEALRQLDSAYKDEFPDSLSHLRNGVDTQLIRMADILFSERMKNTVSEWRAGLLRERNGGSEFQGSISDVNLKFQTTFFHMRPALVVNGLTSRQLRLIKLVTEKYFKDLAYVHATGETFAPQPLIVYSDSTTDRDLLMREVKACQKKEAEMKIQAAIGFRHVIDLLSLERKLIVGHNCFLDLAHVYSKFVGPLPLTAEEFVSSVQTYFPHIIDTKVLLNSDDVLLLIMKKGSTSLSKAFGLLCPPIAPSSTSSGLADKVRVKVEVQVDDQRFSNWNSGAKHEAGYDAFMTGCVFSQACSHLGVDFDSHAQPVDLLDNEKLQKYINHLYLSWVNGDIIDLKTGKSAAESLGSTSMRHRKIVFSNMILLWGLPSKLKAKDIRDCFLKVFGTGSITSIYHLDETAAFVEFSKAELVSIFLELKDSLERENDPISILHPLSKILEGGCVHAASYEIYKEICSSPDSELLFVDQAKAVGVQWKTKQLETAFKVEKHENEISERECQINDFPDELADSLYPSEVQLSK
ncbi:Poly(A)-specific exoribonuclease PARN [Handroanthus impetiginosus]|uniref:Poly(A)-specific exoribonuclease PARN n=1 Tax=Handroanthus impetiginosus TaxID=429701 RepID=A0A2G9H0I8_9LAMI|nr:Poly(A)-specific exoribonuclease PARN [Handroanthus impetiginosus]